MYTYYFYYPLEFTTISRFFRNTEGDLAQMVERSLSMGEAPGSMPGYSNLFVIDFLTSHPTPHPVVGNNARSLELLGLGAHTHSHAAAEPHRILCCWFLILPL